jgi:hypothetical protein
MAQTPLTNAFISLNDIINNFIISYTGKDKLIPDSNRVEVVFHARRCLQEFAYETLKSQFNDTFNLTNTTYTQPADNVSIISVTRDGTIMTEATGSPTLNTYVVNYTAKTVTFSSSAINDEISYTYLSNALTTDEGAAIPKLAEEALYACMVYSILANREKTNPNILQRLLIEKIDKLERSKSRLVFTNFSS